MGHVHPHLPATTVIITASFTIPDRGETSVTVFYRVVLSVRDSTNLAHTSYVDVLLQTSLLESTSNVPRGTTHAQRRTDHRAALGVEGMIRTLGVTSPQTIDGIAYEFVSWSDCGAATHEIATALDNTIRAARVGRHHDVVGGVWTPEVVNISAFAGQTVRLRVGPADEVNGSIIEAGFDDMTVARP